MEISKVAIKREATSNIQKVTDFFVMDGSAVAISEKTKIRRNLFKTYLL